MKADSALVAHFGTVHGTELLTSYIGRLAPSPTGLLHLGHARTFAVARDRAAGGVLRLRIDDLDRSRSRGEYADAAIEDLRWLGIAWQGEPVLQRGRTALYREGWERLALAGLVYPCVCSRRELAEAGAPHEPGGEPLYPGTCRPASVSRAQCERWASEGPGERNWRFLVPDGAVVRWQVGNAGAQAFTVGKDFGDFGVWRRDGFAAYQLASVVDDVEMGVTEVVRGADLLLSTARQILLFRALGAQVPGFHHVPLVIDAHGQRLAKRTDALSIRALRERGRSAAEVLRMAEGG